MPPRLIPFIELAGLALLVAGAFLVALPLGLAAGGASLLLIGWALGGEVE